MTASKRNTIPAEHVGATAPAWTTQHAIAALEHALLHSKASPPILNAARASVTTLRAALAGVGLNSVPAESPRGCTPTDSMLVIAATFRSLAVPNARNKSLDWPKHMSETARTTLGCSFNATLVSMRAIGVMS